MGEREKGSDGVTGIKGVQLRTVSHTLEHRLDALDQTMRELSKRLDETSKRLDAHIASIEDNRGQLRLWRRVVDRFTVAFAAVDERLRKLERVAHEPGTATLRGYVEEILLKREMESRPGGERRKGGRRNPTTSTPTKGRREEDPDDDEFQ